MKIILIIFLSVTLYASKNWIKTEPINPTQTSKPKTTSNFNLLNIEPFNKMMKNVTAIKQLIDNKSKKKKFKMNHKNWFILKTQSNN